LVDSRIGVSKPRYGADRFNRGNRVDGRKKIRHVALFFPKILPEWGLIKAGHFDEDWPYRALAERALSFLFLENFFKTHIAVGFNRGPGRL
jgi:hypothetical protein